ncbi:unnamed protein product [Ilex paraguariensis]|uniref:Uncharacterized protein n=1 Tax=Ilex paraguariensis TaxID=185542 RepID=A0ABC8T3C5_9AQUA
MTLSSLLLLSFLFLLFSFSILLSANKLPALISPTFAVTCTSAVVAGLLWSFKEEISSSVYILSSSPLVLDSLLNDLCRLFFFFFQTNQHFISFLKKLFTM